MNIEIATIADAKILTEVTIESKDYWGYGEEQIKAWTDLLTITEDYIQEKEVYKLQYENHIIGYYAYAKLDDSVIKLDNLFIRPNAIGSGLGKKLMIDLFERIQNMEFDRLVLDSDPNAEQFYSKLGFKVIGKMETSIQNRFLPIMEMKKRAIQHYLKLR